MSPAPTRPLTIDDPTGGADACHVAHPADPGGPDGRLQHIAVEDIHPNPEQPRKHFDAEALRALADSIRERGVLQPIIVRPDDIGGYELVAGERRWRGQPEVESTAQPSRGTALWADAKGPGPSTARLRVARSRARLNAVVRLRLVRHRCGVTCSRSCYLQGLLFEVCEAWL